MSLEHIYNYLALSDDLLTGGMPTAAQLQELQLAGVQTVINLALPDSERALPDEASIVRSLDMEYIGIPVRWDAPQRGDLEAFMQAMQSHQQQKLFVHCQANYRVSGFILLYRVLRLGWERQPAFEDVRRIWDPAEYPAWQQFIGDNLGRP